MPYYLGIDGGGTKTTCAVGDEAKLLASATSGPSNIVRVGEALARESLQQAVRQACAAAGITPSQVNRTCIGGSGAARPELAELVRRALAEILPTPIDVVGDMQIALEAAFDTGPGVIVNGGTGSFAYGRAANGKTVRAGGWGFAIGDEGSAHWIGREAVIAVLRRTDEIGEDPTLRLDLSDDAFAASLMKCWGLATLNDLALAANSIPRPDFAALFPPVTASKEILAQQVQARAAVELARLASIVIGRLFADPEILTVPVAMTGSVFRHSNVVRDNFYNELRRFDIRAEVLTQVIDPVEGALRLARRAKP